MTLLIKMRRAALLIAALTVGLIVAACGSSSSHSSSSSGSSGSTGSSASTKQSSASGSPYVLGSIVDETGAYASSDAGGAKGIQAWASYVNAHGGIGGHKVQVEVKDDQSNPTVALSDVKAFAAQKNVIALVGSTSAVEASWAPIASAEHLPVVGDYPFTPVDYTDKYIFPQGTTVGSILYGETYVAAKLAHAKKLAVFYCAEVSECAATATGVKASATGLGATVVNAQAVAETAPNYDAVCHAAQSSGATAVVMALNEATIVSVAESCASVGYKPAWVAQTTGLVPDQTKIPALNGHLYGVVQTFPWVSAGTTAQKAFQAGVKAAKVPSSDYGAALSLGWTSGQLFATAMAHATGTASRQSVADAVWKLPSGTTLGGLAPPLTYKTNAASPQQKCFFVMKVAGGKWTAPYGATKTFCQK